MALSDGVSSRIRVASTGPMGVDEYSWQMRNRSDPTTRCVFDSGKGQVRDEEISLSGFFTAGEYLWSRSLNEDGTYARTILLADSLANQVVNSRDGNGSLLNRMFLSGGMNGRDLIM
jgi:hypothetical protein